MLSIATNLGPLIQQIAFRCDDLIDFAAKLKGSGAPILPIPKNYYDYMSATMGLDPAFVDRLRDLNILYDRSAGGEFLHCYSENFKGRFFLEFVQRIGAYEGFGLPNAPFRLAAQARRRTQVAA